MSDLTQDPDATAGDAELAELRALARRVQPVSVAWETPPADLWDNIAAAADVADGPGGEPAADDPRERDNVRFARRCPTVDRSAGPRECTPPGLAGVGRSRQPQPWCSSSRSVS